jgi:hypothetical protein
VVSEKIKNLQQLFDSFGARFICVLAINKKSTNFRDDHPMNILNNIGLVFVDRKHKRPKGVKKGVVCGVFIFQPIYRIPLKISVCSMSTDLL